MDVSLVVTRSFANFHPGDVIDDPTRIAKVLSGEHAAHVVRVNRTNMPVPHTHEA